MVYVPQTDDAAATWIKWFTKYPQLRMVIAISPRFVRIAKDPVLRSQILALKKEGRLELAMQIPNAPILPLLVEDPPYGFPDDVIQLMAQAKSTYFKAWSQLPQGLVLPYGAISPRLLSLLERLGVTWMVGAAGLPAIDGPYQSGSLLLWDGAPSGKASGTVVRVWDERQMKVGPLESWMMELKDRNGSLILPQEAGTSTVPLPMNRTWKPKTWDESTWSMWAGDPARDAAWRALKRTRDTLEKYKNSGQASVQRLDLAFDEIYGAQNSNYFSSIGNTALSPALVEEREHEFQATLLAVYRLIGQPPPEDLFISAATAVPAGTSVSSTSVHAESFPDGREHVGIEDAMGDALVPGGGDLKALDVWSGTDSVHWIVTLASTPTAPTDIYIDLNGQPNAGTPTFLAGRPYGTSPKDAWEYAIAIAGPTATLYRTQGAGTYEIVQTFPVVVEGNRMHVTIPRDLMRGNPRRWGYQVLVGDATLSDFIDPLEMSQKDLWQDLISGQRNDIPFVRVSPK